MVIPSLALYVLAQTAKPDYTVPLGASSEFHHMVIDLQSALQAKEYPKAQKLANLLPKYTVTYRIDQKKLNDTQKDIFPQAIELAASRWTASLKRDVGITLKYVTTPTADISFTFEPKLNNVAGSNLVAGATWFLGTDSTQPRVEAVIGLKRGPKLEAVTDREVFNESLYTFGTYLGLAPNPQFGTAMGRLDGQMVNATEVTAQEARTGSRNLALSKLLRQAVASKSALEISHPQINVEKKSLAFDEVFQGDQGVAKMLITNKGNSKLELFVAGDCGCITGSIEGSLDPGKSTLLTGYFDTRELSGDVNHNLVLRTNDPEQPIIIIPAGIKVLPRAEFIYPDSNTIYMDGTQPTFTFYLNSVEPKPLNLTSASVSGAPFKVETSAFEGEVPDYAKGGQKQKIRGYKVTIDTTPLPKELVFGRSMAVTYFRTDNPKMPVAKATFFVQKGIAVLPESVYLGAPKGVADTTFVMLRPGRPFKIKKVTSPSKNLTFQITNRPDMTEYSIKVIYDGNAPAHRVKSEIVVETDDAKQSTFRLPVQTSQI